MKRVSNLEKGFYPKPRVGLGKSAQPLRENPIRVEQIGAQGHHSGGLGSAPAHAPLFQAAVDDQGHSALNHAAAHRIALLSPVLIGTNPRPLVFQRGDRFLDGLKCLGGQSCTQGAQAVHRLIHPALPQPGPVHGQLVLLFSLRERLGSCRYADGVTHLVNALKSRLFLP